MRHHTAQDTRMIGKTCLIAIGRFAFARHNQNDTDIILKGPQHKISQD